MAQIMRSSQRPLYMIGQGFTNCIIPSFITQHFLLNPHVYTPYTPYQAEISQGRLEMLYNYQQIVKGITKKDIAVASLIDNGQVSMDLVTLMTHHTKKKTIYVQNSMNVPVLNCIRMRAKHLGVNIRYFDSLRELMLFESHKTISDLAGIFIQTPCKFGNLPIISQLRQMKEINPKLLVACMSDLMYLSSHTNIGYDDVDFVFGNGGNMGVGLNYGGPQVA